MQFATNNREGVLISAGEEGFRWWYPVDQEAGKYWEKRREQEIVEAFSNGEKINPLYCKTSGINVLAPVYTEQYLKIFYLFSDL